MTSFRSVPLVTDPKDPYFFKDRTYHRLGVTIFGSKGCKIIKEGKKSKNCQSLSWVKIFFGYHFVLHSNLLRNWNLRSLSVDREIDPHIAKVTVSRHSMSKVLAFSRTYNCSWRFLLETATNLHMGKFPSKILRYWIRYSAIVKCNGS